MRTVASGATGYVGSVIVEELRARGLHVVGPPRLDDRLLAQTADRRGRAA